MSLDLAGRFVLEGLEMRGGLGVVVVAPVVLAIAAALPQRAGADETAGSPHEHTHPHTDSASEEPAEPAHGSQRLLLTLAGYSVAIAGASLLGGWLPGRVHLSHLRFQLLLSVVGGLLLGIGILHLLPHSVHELGARRIDTVALWMMGGVLLMFFLLRAFHVHHHEPEAGTTSPDAHVSDAEADHAHDHDTHAHGHCPDHQPSSRLSWAGLFFGLGVHTLLDGVALGAAMQADAAHAMGVFVGFGVLVGIVLHKPLDSLSITTMMMQAGRSAPARWTVNVVYACLCPLGAAAFLLGVWSMGATGHEVVGCTLAFSAGVFACIALADLLPEMEFHTHHRWRLSAALIVGIALAWAIRFLEPAGMH